MVLFKLDQLEKHKLGLGKMQLNMLIPLLVKLLPLCLMLWGINLDLWYMHLFFLSLPSLDSGLAYMLIVPIPDRNQDAAIVVDRVVVVKICYDGMVTDAC